MMFPRLLLPVLLVTLCVGGPSPARAQLTGLSTPDFHEKLTGTLLTVLLHETAHALIEILDPVITGPEEDIADEFAIILLLGEAERGNDDALTMVEAYASTFLALWQRSTEGLKSKQQEGETKNLQNLIPLNWFLDEHSFDVKRAVNALCLLFGANPDRAISEIIQSKLPVDKIWMARCIQDYRRKRSVWKRVLDPFRPPDYRSGIVIPEGLMSGIDGPTFDFNPATPTHGSHFKLKFSVNQAEQTRYYDFGKLLSAPYQKALGLFSLHVGLPFDVPVFVRHCDAPDAYFQPAEKQIVLCHEFADMIAGDIVRYETGLNYETWWGRERAYETQAHITGVWRSIERYGGLVGTSGTEIDLNEETGIATIRHLKLNDPGTEILHSEIQFTTFWGVGNPPFDQEFAWVWFLDPAKNSMFWSKINDFTQSELNLGEFVFGIYQRVK